MSFLEAPRFAVREERERVLDSVHGSTGLACEPMMVIDTMAKSAFSPKRIADAGATSDWPAETARMGICWTEKPPARHRAPGKAGGQQFRPGKNLSSLWVASAARPIITLVSFPSARHSLHCRGQAGVSRLLQGVRALGGNALPFYAHGQNRRAIRAIVGQRHEVAARADGSLLGISGKNFY